MSVTRREDTDILRRALFVAAAVLFSSAIGFAASRTETHPAPEAALTSMRLSEGLAVTEIGVVDGRPALLAATPPGSPPNMSLHSGCRLFFVADDPLRLTSNEAVSCDVGSDLRSPTGGRHEHGIRIEQFGVVGGAGGGYQAIVVGNSGADIFALEQPNELPGSGAGCSAAWLTRIDLASGSALAIARLPAGLANDDGSSCIGPLVESAVWDGRIYLLDGRDSSGGFSALYSIAEGPPN